MPTRKNIKSKKSNKRFRKTRSKRQTRKSKKKTRSKRGGGQVLSTNFNTEPDSPPPPPPPPPPPECPICTEVLNENSITTKCGHTFHTDCLIPWCRQHREATTCPACRDPIGPICRELLFTELEKLLFDAITVGEIDMLYNILKIASTRNQEQLDINVKNKDGDTPLILAAKNDQFEIVDMLLTFGADVDELNEHGDAAFHVTDNNDIISLLFEYNTGYYDPEDAAVEDFIFGGGNHGGKRKQKTRKRYKTKR